MDSVQEKFNFWLENADKATKTELLSLSGEQIEDAFYKDIEFGTAGLRGLMGAGTNRINSYTIIKACAGIADFLAENSDKPTKTICISFDCRNNSNALAMVAARVFAAKNIEVLITKKLAPTPYLSFMVRHFCADMGVMITASHNSAEYNGFKVYNSEGCQLTDVESSILKGYIDKINPFSIALPRLSDEITLRKIKFRSVKTPYLNQITKFLMSFRGTGGGELKVTYSALCGTGAQYVLPVFRALNIRVNVVQIKPDGNFSSCKNPNPESDEAFCEAIKLATERASDLILATDPDADRVGVMCKVKGGYRRLSGNEVGLLLMNFLLVKCRKSQPIVIRSVVSSPIADKIAEKYGAKMLKTLTGFKYIGEKICSLTEEDGEFLFAFEDSAGYLPLDHVRDKDGVITSALICLMAREYKKNGRTILDALDSIYEHFGQVTNTTISYKFDGQSGAQHIYNLMEKLKNSPIYNNETRFSEIVDFLDPNNPITRANNLPLTNMVLLKSDDASIFVRPSGTEPLIKVYICCPPQKTAQIKQFCDNFFSLIPKNP